MTSGARPDLSKVTARPWHVGSNGYLLGPADDPIHWDTEGLGAIWGEDADAAFIVYAVNNIEACETRLAKVDYDAMRVTKEWPTPNHMRRTADAIDSLTPARYGDVLRWFADRCDSWVWHMGDPMATERLQQARAFLAPGQGAEEGSG